MTHACGDRRRCQCDTRLVMVSRARRTPSSCTVCGSAGPLAHDALACPNVCVCVCIQVCMPGLLVWNSPKPRALHTRFLPTTAQARTHAHTLVGVLAYCACTHTHTHTHTQNASSTTFSSPCIPQHESWPPRSRTRTRHHTHMSNMMCPHAHLCALKKDAFERAGSTNAPGYASCRSCMTSWA